MDITSIQYYILASLLFLGSLIPLIIYLRYGREPTIVDAPNYETDLPTDDPPAIVNAICSGFSKKVGEPDMNGFIATIMDLIDRNYLLLVDNNPEEADSNSMSLEINSDYDPDSLWNFENTIINFLSEYEQDGVISMDMVSESLSYANSANFFKETYKNWKNEVRDTLWDTGNIKEAFLRKGDKYLKIFGIIGLIVSIVVFFVVFPYSWAIMFNGYLFALFYILIKTRDKTVHLIVYGLMGLIVISISLFRIIYGHLSPVELVFLSSIILGASSIISILLPEKIAGCWTDYGKKYYAQWHSFKKYIEDYSLIKEYSPDSVKVWDKYLVYATALGVADKVKKSMEMSLPNDRLIGSDLYSFQYYNSPTSIFKNAITTALEPD